MAQTVSQIAANHQQPPIALTIAGSDSSGGAGIQADLKTFMAFQVHGCSAVSCVTAQNSCGVERVDALSPDALKAQVETVRSDLPVAALKSGMLLNADLIEATAEVLKDWSVPRVIDPVMVSRSGAILLESDAIEALRRQLLPLADVLTPNLHEAALLSGESLSDPSAMENAARRIQAMGPAVVLIKGGGEARWQGQDLLLDGDQLQWLPGPRVDTPHSHGTGCTLSAAITALMAQQVSVTEAIGTGRAYVKAALQQSLAIGSGQGPVCHWINAGGGQIDK